MSDLQHVNNITLVMNIREDITDALESGMQYETVIEILHMMIREIEDKARADQT